MTVHLADNVFDGVLFCVVFFPTRYLGWDLGLNCARFLRINIPILILICGTFVLVHYVFYIGKASAVDFSGTVCV